MHSDRRRLLAYGGLAALLGLVGVGAGVRYLDDGADANPSTPTDAPPTTSEAPPTSEPGATDWLPLVERFAPELHFGRRERWFPTDPRNYVGGNRVVDGPEALVSYSEDARGAGAPPAPTVFYNVVPVDDTIVALQYWMYSVFDQFAVNFHWHDWELLSVFVDVETEEVVLLSASAHARSCPNNEYLRPEMGPGDRPVVLSEVGSHSSTTDVNGNRPSFERLGAGGLAPDVSNAFVRPLAGAIDQPFAYGLPRDEGVPVPYSLPELDDTPLHEHLGLPLSDFVDADVTIRDWRGLASPPSGIPLRDAGTVLTPPGSATAGDASYAIEPLADVADAVDDLTGPQLSFEFAIPGFVEDRFASHITTAGIPWQDPRASDPVRDITDPDHRRAVTGEVPGGLSDRVVGGVSTLLGRGDGDLPGVDGDDRDAVEPFASVSAFPLPVEVACLLRSDPTATVTSGGVFRFLDVEPGVHELVLNGPGLAPYAERFEHGGGTVRPGVDGRVTLVASEDAVRLRADRRGAGGVRRVRVVESFAGPVFDARPVEEGRFAAPVHRDGTYRVEVVDDDGLRGSVRVEGNALDGEPLPPISTGKAAMARELAALLSETASLARELGGSQREEAELSIPAEFDAAADDARAAAEDADVGYAQGANERLADVVTRLRDVRERLAEPEPWGYTEGNGALLRHRAAEALDMARTAYSTNVAG